MPKSRNNKRKNNRYQDHDPNKTKGPIAVSYNYPIYVYKKIPIYIETSVQDGYYVIIAEDGYEHRIPRIVTKKVMIGHETELLKKIPKGTVIRYQQRKRKRFKNPYPYDLD